MVIIFLILHILAFILLVINYIKCLKRKTEWNALFKYEVIALILTILLMLYYSNLPGVGFAPGLTYFGEEFINLCALFMYIVSLVISIATRLILILFENKKTRKNSILKITALIAKILLAFGILTLGIEQIQYLAIEKIDATIIDYNDHYNAPIVEYTVDNETYRKMIYRSTIEIDNSKLNDKVQVYYDKNSPSDLAYPEDYKKFYISCFIISLILFGIVFIKDKKMILKKQCKK